MSNTPILTSYQESIAPWNEQQSGEEDFNVSVTFTINCNGVINSDDYYIEKSTGKAFYEGDGGAEFCAQHFTPAKALADYKLMLVKKRNELAAKVHKESSWLSRLNKVTAETLYNFHEANFRAFQSELTNVECKMQAVAEWTLELDDWEITD